MYGFACLGHIVTWDNALWCFAALCEWFHQANILYKLMTMNTLCCTDCLVGLLGLQERVLLMETLNLNNSA